MALDVVNARHFPQKLTARWARDLNEEDIHGHPVYVPILWREIDGQRELLCRGPMEYFLTPEGNFCRFIINPFAPTSMIVIYTADEYDDSEQSLQKIKIHPDRPCDEQDVEFRYENRGDKNSSRIEAVFLDERSFLFYYYNKDDDQCTWFYVRDNQIIGKNTIWHNYEPHSLETLDRNVFMERFDDKAFIVHDGKYEDFYVQIDDDFVQRYHFLKLLRLLYSLTKGLFNAVLTVMIEHMDRPTPRIATDHFHAAFGVDLYTLDPFEEEIKTMINFRG